jgi:hypothetical protein
MVVALCSCDKDDDGDDKKDENPTSVIADNTITATVENGNSYNDEIDTVKAVIVLSMKYDSETGKDRIEYYEVARSAYSNGKFTLKLPETVSDSYLSGFDEMWDGEGIPDGVTVNNTNVKVEFMDIFAYKSGKIVGRFYAGYTNEPEILTGYVYVNGDVSITGTDVDGDKYNLHFKKGWNIEYMIDNDDTNEETTQAPDVTLKWYYHEDDGYTSANSVSTKIPALLTRRKK